MNSSAGDTVIPTKTSSKTTGESRTLERDGCCSLVRPESKPVTRKRRQTEPVPFKTEIPRKTPRHEDSSPEHELTQIHSGFNLLKSHVEEPEIRARKRPLPTWIDSRCKSFKSQKEAPKHLRLIPQFDGTILKSSDTCSKDDSLKSSSSNPANLEQETRIIIGEEWIDLSDDINQGDDAIPKGQTNNTKSKINVCNDSSCGTSSVNSESTVKLSPNNEERDELNEIREALNSVPILREKSLLLREENLRVAVNVSKDNEKSGLLKKPPDVIERCRRRTEKADDVAKLKKTIQWLEEGARKMREDLAAVRSELHEERKAAKLTRRELNTAIREVRTSEAAKNQQIISDLKTR